MQPQSYFKSSNEECGFGQTYEPSGQNCEFDRLLLICLVVVAVLLLVVLPAAIALIVYCITVIYGSKWTDKKPGNRDSDVVTSNHKPRSIYSRRKQEINKYLKQQEQKTSKREPAIKMPVRKSTFIRASPNTSNDSDVHDM